MEVDESAKPKEQTKQSLLRRIFGDKLANSLGDKALAAIAGGLVSLLGYAAYSSYEYFGEHDLVIVSKDALLPRSYIGYIGVPFHSRQGCERIVKKWGDQESIKVSNSSGDMSYITGNIPVNLRCVAHGNNSMTYIFLSSTKLVGDQFNSLGDFVDEATRDPSDVLNSTEWDWPYSGARISVEAATLQLSESESTRLFDIGILPDELYQYFRKKFAKSEGCSNLRERTICLIKFPGLSVTMLANKYGASENGDKVAAVFIGTFDLNEDFPMWDDSHFRDMILSIPNSSREAANLANCPLCNVAPITENLPPWETEHTLTHIVGLLSKMGSWMIGVFKDPARVVRVIYGR